MEFPKFDIAALVPGTPDSIPLPGGDFWIFAYGSLMWNPGFKYVEACPATLFGYHRRLCLWSIRYRGNASRPGLVLGLDRGGSCQGYAYKADKSNSDPIIDYLCDREMITGAYEAKICSLRLDNGDNVEALTFISKPDHPHFAPRLAMEDTISVVRNARGDRGHNVEYVLNTVSKMNQINILNTELHKVADQLEPKD